MKTVNHKAPGQNSASSFPVTLGDRFTLIKPSIPVVALSPMNGKKHCENNLQLKFKCNHIIAISSSYRKHSTAEELSKRARRAKIDSMCGKIVQDERLNLNLLLSSCSMSTHILSLSAREGMDKYNVYHSCVIVLIECIISRTSSKYF